MIDSPPADVHHITGRLRNKATLALTLIVGSIPLLRTVSFFRLFFGPDLLRSWDGSAHLAASYLYDRTVFPDTFGWTRAWFAGMPLPNFYPPLFYWTVAALHHSGLPLLLGFKLMVTIPFLLVPAALGVLSWHLSARDTLITVCTTLVACFPLVDSHLQSNFPGGMTYVSTFNEGLCTQPLGLILLTAWIAIYFGTITSWRRMAFASFMLAFTVLANFFSVVAALPLAVVGLIHEFSNTTRPELQSVSEAPLGLTFKAITLVCGVWLCAFWLVPVIAEFPYFVTRPLQVSWSEMIPPGLWIWIWFSAAFGGATSMVLSGTSYARAFIVGCLTLMPLTLPFMSQIHWIPSQPPRVLSTLTFLMAVPVGWLLATLVRLFVHALSQAQRRRNSWCTGVVAVLVLLGLRYIKPAPLNEAVYTGDSPIVGVLEFARTHHDGRYVVENAWQHKEQHDSRALNAYLGMQGNESLNIAFHEAAASSVFFTPLVNALSASADSFGISAALANDLDFYNQPPEEHLRRARQVGVRYIVCSTPWIKRRFRQQPDLIEHNLGRWSVFEMKTPPAPDVEVLQYLPALVVSSLDFKERKSDSHSFVRLSEEQFNSGHSDVLLAHAETPKIDKVSNLEDFGALVLETYDCSNEDVAFETVRRFAQNHLVILISSNRSLYARLASHISELPHVLMVRQDMETHAEWLNQSMPWLELDQSSIRKQWKLIEQALENAKVPASSASSQASISPHGAGLSVQLTNTMGTKTPILLRSTFHPNWVRPDGQRIYATTPFFMLTFANGPFETTFRRTGIELASLIASAGTFFVLLLVIIAPDGMLVSSVKLRPQPTAVEAG